MEQVQRRVDGVEILVLEDDPNVLRGIVMTLGAKKSWNVHGFLHFQEALDYLQQHSVGSMLVDFKLENSPHVTGIEFLERAKQMHPLATQILISGEVQKADAIKAINRLDLYYLLLKPWLPEDLLDIVGKGIERNQLRVAAQRYLEEIEESNAKLRETERELREVNKHLRLTQDDLLRQQKQAAIGALVQGICHNLNTPLGLILGHVEQLSESLVEFEEEHGYPPVVWRPSMRTINEAMNRIQDLIQNLITKSRMEQDPERRWLDLGDVIQQELTFLQADPFLRHRVHVSLVSQKDLPKIKANYADISQIFGNLIRNALDAMVDTTQPKLQIRLFSDERFVCFEIHDNGPGVPDALRERIFDPFFTTKRLAVEPAPKEPMLPKQEPSVTTEQTELPQSERKQMWARNMSGAGLGLYSVSQILASYQGDVSVAASSALGGACFCVRFPVQSATASQT